MAAAVTIPRMSSGIACVERVVGVRVGTTAAATTAVATPDGSISGWGRNAGAALPAQAANKKAISKRLVCLFIMSK
jgi:hypothetical protein